MNYFLNMTAVILILYWAIGFFALAAGPVIHILLFLAAIIILLQTVWKARKYT